MITIEKLVVSYDKDQRVIDNLDIIFPFDTIHGIVGLNGSGKTTLLNAIYGLKAVDSGQVLYHDRKINKREMSFLVTENFFYSNITGREYLELFTNCDFDIESWNRLFLLPLDAVIDHYSTGMKKKLAFFGVIRQDKPVMILDEPFNGLDIETCRIIRRILIKLKERGKTILITSHIIETLTNLCDYIHYLEQ
ncbi:MAG: ATP-binding cassette domain-containing protein, partial [Bacteroidota bacterium]